MDFAIHVHVNFKDVQRKFYHIIFLIYDAVIKFGERRKREEATFERYGQAAWFDSSI